MIKLVVNIRDSTVRPTLVTAVFFNECSINLKYDSICSTFKFQLFFNPDDSKDAELAAVSHIHECQIFYVHPVAGRYATRESNGQPVFEQTNEELIITGFMLSQYFSDSAEPSYVEIGGYSKAGVLGDCDFPSNAPLQNDGLSFRQIVNQNVVPYFSNPKSGGFNFHIKSSRADSTFQTNAASSLASLKNTISNLDSDSDEDLGKTTAKESKNILSYLKELAIQKNLVLSTDIFGNLLVNAAYTGDDYLFEVGTDNSIKFIDISMNYNGQPLHSQIEVLRDADKNGGNQGYAIVYNPLVPVVFRPRLIKLTSGTDNDVQKAALSELGAELKNIPLKISLESPIANGKFIMPNNTVKVQSKKCYLYEPSKWFIEEVNYKKTAEAENCEVTCVLPGVYGGQIVNPFIDANLNLPRL